VCRRATIATECHPGARNVAWHTCAQLACSQLTTAGTTHTKNTTIRYSSRFHHQKNTRCIQQSISCLLACSIWLKLAARPSTRAHEAQQGLGQQHRRSNIAHVSSRLKVTDVEPNSANGMPHGQTAPVLASGNQQAYSTVPTPSVPSTPNPCNRASQLHCVPHPNLP
jgi:hypothetical protein